MGHNICHQEDIKLYEAISLVAALEAGMSEAGLDIGLMEVTDGQIKAHGEYHAMNSDGYYIGYESFEVVWPMVAKKIVDAHLSPMTDWAVSLTAFEVTHFIPAIPEDEWEEAGYYPSHTPLDDFLYQMVEGMIGERIKHYTPTFDREQGVWCCGDFTWKIGTEKLLAATTTCRT